MRLSASARGKKLHPREIIEGVERWGKLPSGEGERLSGYGVLGIRFDSGHLLGLRRFVASSIGTKYTCVWHRDPEGRWRFIQNVPPEQACPRYFGCSLSESFTQRVGIEWSGPRDFTVSIDGDYDIFWHVSLKDRLATRLMSGIAARIPERWWRRPAVLELMNRLAGPALGVGRYRFTGRVPSGQGFATRLKRVWTISSSLALIGGRNAGEMMELTGEVSLGDYYIPRRGLFVVGDAWFEPFDPGRHRATMAEPAAPRAGVSGGFER